MSEWKIYKLGDVGKIITGKTPPTANLEYFGDKYPFITPRDMNTQKVILSTERYLSDTGKEYLKNNLLPKKSICVSCIGSDLGKVVVTSQESFTNQQLNSIVCSEKFDEDFIYYSCVQLSEQIRTIGKSSTAVPIVNKTSFSGFEFSAPKNKTTQTAIAQILTSLDDKIELNLQMNQTLEDMAQAIFKEWFINFKFPGFDGEMVNGLPKGWRMGKFEELMEFTNGYAFKSTDLLDNYEDDCYFVFKMGNIKKGGGLKYDGTKSFYKKENALNLKKYILKRGDLLMCMTDMKDNVALLGHTALMNEDDKFIVNQRVGLLRPKNDISIDYPYLYILTNFPEFIIELRSRANRGVQVNLSTSEIKNIQVVIPPKNINALFDSTFKPVFNKIFSNIEQIQSLTQTRDTLLPKLMCGKIKVKA